MHILFLRSLLAHSGVLGGFALAWDRNRRGCRWVPLGIAGSSHLGLIWTSGSRPGVCTFWVCISRILCIVRMNRYRISMSSNSDFLALSRLHRRPIPGECPVISSAVLFRPNVSIVLASYLTLPPFFLQLPRFFLLALVSGARGGRNLFSSSLGNLLDVFQCSL